MRRQLGDIERQIQEINWQRKSEQTATYDKLAQLEVKYVTSGCVLLCSDGGLFGSKRPSSGRLE